MKKYLQLFVLILLSLSSYNVLAQNLGDYIFSTGVDATKWVQLSATTSLITPGQGDAGASSVQNIGFSFAFGGILYTQFSVNTDGNLRFGAMETSTANYSKPFNALNVDHNNPKINMLGCDGFLSDTGYIRHAVMGVAPNRVCIIEFAVAIDNATSRSALLKWQVQLYEGSNDIQIVYPSTTPAILPNLERQVGMCVSASDIVLINADHSSSIYDEAVPDNNIAVGNWPDAGRYYYFDASDICRRPRNLSATNITETSARIIWNSSASAQSYDIFITDQNIVPDANTTPMDTTANTYYDLSGLVGSTQYHCYVRTNCGSSYSNWAELDFATDCPTYVTIPYAESFDNYGTVANSSFPLCWKRLTNSTLTYPYISSSGPSSAPGSLYFYSTSSKYSCAIAPRIDTSTNHINTLTVHFKIKKNNVATGHGALQVGVMTNPNTYSTFTAVRSFSGSEWSSANTWYDVEVPLTNYTGRGTYIAIRKPAGVSGYTFVDDFSIYETPVCLTPTNIAFSNVTNHSADVTWTAGGSESEWQAAIVPHGGNVATATPVNTSVSSYTFNNLTANTTYDVYLRSVCGNDVESNWTSAFSFRTLCPPISDFPYTESFDTYGYGLNTSYPQCWTRKSTDSTVIYPYISAASPFSDPASLYFYSSENYYSMAVIPEINTAVMPLNALTINFMIKKTSSDDGYGNIQVGVMTDLSDYDSFTSIRDIPGSALANVNQWYEINIPIIEYSGSGSYIVLRKNKGTTGYTFIDNFQIFATPYCQVPEDVVISNITDNSAEIDWTAQDDHNLWDVVVVPHGDSLETGNVENAFQHPYTVGNLLDNTEYDVYVRTNCGTDVSNWTAVTSFITRCLPTNEIPYIENFDNDGSGNTGCYPNCWGRMTNYTTNYPYIDNVRYNGVGSLYLYSGGGYYSLATSQALDLSAYPANSLMVSFKAKATNTSYGKLNVGIMTDPTDLNTLTVLKYIYPEDYTNTRDWETFDFILPNAYTDSVVYLAFYAPSGGHNYVHVDAVSLDYIPTCIAPANLTVSNISSSSAVLNWDEPVIPQDSYTVEYIEFAGQSDWILVDAALTGNTVSITGLTANTLYNVRIYSNCYESDTVTISFFTDSVVPFTCAPPILTNITAESESIAVSWIPGSDETTWDLEYISDNDLNWISEGIVTTSPYVISNLLPSTHYSIRMRSNCGNDVSEWVMANTQTVCSSISALPYLQDFETATGSDTSSFISCWERGAGYPYTRTSHQHSGYYALYFNNAHNVNCYAATPRFIDTINMANLQISFYAYKQSNTSSIEVGIMTDPSDYNTFQPIGTFSPDSLSTWTLANINTNNYVGNGHYIAFRQTSYNGSYIYIDDIDIHEIPVCGQVSNITVSQITSSSADLVWTPAGYETEWEILYGPAGTVDFGNDVPIVSLAPSNFLDNLISNTIYDVYIRVVCDDGGYGVWEHTSFRTDCGRVDIPFVENFDSFNTGSSAEIHCWTAHNTYSTTTFYPYVSSSYAASGSQSLYFKSSSSTYNLIATPQFESTVNLSTLQVTFNMRSSSASGSKLIVGVMTNPENPSTFVPVDTVSANVSGTWDLFEVPLTSYNGTGNYIAFKNLNTTGSSQTIYLDDISINTMPSCLKPQNFVSIGHTVSTVDLAWTEMGSATTWNVVYGPSGFTPNATSVMETVNDTMATISNLTTGYTYDFYVRANCGDETSAWVGPVTCIPGVYIMPTTGTHSITMCGGTIYDDGGVNGNYSDNCNSTLTIYPSETDSVVSIEGTITSEWGTDFIYVYEGATADLANLMQTVTSSSTGMATHFGPFTSLSGPLTLVFISDYFSNYDGFAIEVSCVSATQCQQPSDVAVQSVSTSDAIIEWASLESEYVGFNIALSTVADFNPNSCPNIFTSSTNSYLFSDLTPNTTYYVKVQTDCGSDVSLWSEELEFTTDVDDSDCPAPTDLSVSNIHNNDVTLSWMQEEGTADRWEVNYRKQGYAFWSNSIADTVPYMLTGLEGNTNYEILVIAYCTNGYTSNPSDTLIVHTDNVGVEDYEASNIDVYPNPTTGMVQVSSSKFQVSGMDVYDVYGKLLNTLSAGGNEVEINLGDYAAGVYFLSIFTENGVITKRIVKK